MAGGLKPVSPWSSKERRYAVARPCAAAVIAAKFGGGSMRTSFLSIVPISIGMLPLWQPAEEILPG
jgi:hypothetical protein